MTVIKDYFKYTKENTQKYGEKTIVLMQVGAFFEVYGYKESKKGEMKGSKIEEFGRIIEYKIVPKKQCVGKKNIFMAGFQKHLLDKFVKKLNDKGYTIAVYTQDVQAPKSNRSLIGVYSPGTNFNNNENKLTNNIMCIQIHLDKRILLNKDPLFMCGLSSINIITGKSVMYEYSKKYFHFPTTYDEIERFTCIYQPHELIIIYSGVDEENIREIVRFAKIKTETIHFISMDNKEDHRSKTALRFQERPYQEEIFKKFYQPKDMDFFVENIHFNEYPLATQSFCFLLDFVNDHQPDLVRKISEPEIENINNYLMLANHTLKQLNIIQTEQHTGKLSSALSFLNKCKTPMGKRTFKELLLKPTSNIEYLQKEYKITQYVKENFDQFEFLRLEFIGFRDIERLYRTIVLNRVCPSELVQFYENMKSICVIQKRLKKDATISKFISNEFNIPNFDIIKSCKSVMKEISHKINLKEAENVNQLEFETNIFKRNIFEDVDKIEESYIDQFDQMYCIQKWLGKHIRDKNKFGNKLVKIHQTEKTGYNLDITKRRTGLLKDKFKSFPNINNVIYISEYDKKQKNIDINISELTFTVRSGNNLKIGGPQLNKIYNSINEFKHQLKEKLQEHYKVFISTLSKWKKEMENMVKYVSLLDVLITKAYVAKKYNYCCPELKEGEKSFFVAKNLRHCLIEHLNKNELYVPNDVSLGCGKDDGILLYGTNAVGKSSLIRSIGISIILAQAGMFVPCSEFTFNPYHKIFTRILGNDDIFKGLSTFAVEMSELRTILNFSDKNSLILGDELCSGTETNSAISIFVAGLTKLHAKNSSFIFATHFHQITKMKRIKNLNKVSMKHMEVKYDAAKDLLIYNRKLKEGPGNSMYGLEVCKSLSLPQDFLDLAYEIRNEDKKKYKKTRYNAKKIKGKCEICNKEAKDIHHLQFQEDANEEGFIQHIHKNHPANLMSICKECHDHITKNRIRYRRTKTSDGIKFVEI